MNYTDYVNELGVLLPQQLNGTYTTAPFVDTNYNTILPRCIEYAELMMYRDPDLNFIYTRTVDSSQTFTANSRTFTLPTQIIIPEQINAVVPVSTAPAAGTRVPFKPVSVDYINFIWPTETQATQPGATGYPDPVFAMLNSTQIIVAPTPDYAYTVEVTGVFRPAPLAQTANATTYLTTNLPDLFIAASMIYMSGVMENFGQQADNPQMALSWSQQYESLKKGPVIEEARKRSQSASWTPYVPTVVSSPPR